ncbi:hypothetical protein EOM39_00195 [Candidatus Gracilibacteria bacterium]|nr:hypothetical protein [Candidatus Gracilibacteria bacterium]
MEQYMNNNFPVTYLVGVLLGINAIKDSYLWIDSPDCFFFKNDFVQGNHDITSNLRQADGKHKFLSTIADADNVIGNRNNRFIETLKIVYEQDFVKQLFVSSMPMSQIVGTDYDGIIKEVKESYKTNKPIFNIPSRSMTDCWLDGYSDLLFSIAKNIDIDGGKTEKTNIAIIGNLFDRGEGDCIANVEELKRIIESLGLNVVSIWLDGGKFEDILNVKNAGTIISLPYGRKAAKKIANRLDADLLELDLPFGFDKTGEFINTIGEHFNVEEKAKKFIEKELTLYNKIDIIKWVIPHTFIGKKISFYGDPYLLNGIVDLSNTLGFELEKIYIHGEEKHISNNKSIVIDKDKVVGYFNNEEDVDNIDLFISNSHNKLNGYSKTKIMQFGFPSYDYHVYTYEPYFGYKGTLLFINRIANMLNM